LAGPKRTRLHLHVEQPWTSWNLPHQREAYRLRWVNQFLVNLDVVDSERHHSIWVPFCKFQIERILLGVLDLENRRENMVASGLVGSAWFRSFSWFKWWGWLDDSWFGWWGWLDGSWLRQLRVGWLLIGLW
jgi:hypothetical protein